MEPRLKSEWFIWHVHASDSGFLLGLIGVLQTGFVLYCIVHSNNSDNETYCDDRQIKYTYIKSSDWLTGFTAVSV